MKFELLPNEIFIECFEYLNAFDIFHSFDQLNDRFNQLIRNIPIHLNYQHTQKLLFDKFCMKMLSESLIKSQIYLLQISNENSCDQIKEFLSWFSLDEFVHLQGLSLMEVDEHHAPKLEHMLPLLTNLIDFRLIKSKIDDQKLISLISTSKLHRLSVRKLPENIQFFDEPCRITHLTLSYCYRHKIDEILRNIPLLKYLNIKNISSVYLEQPKDSLEISPHVHLKQLILTNYHCSFEAFELLVRQTPNLHYLTMVTNYNDEIVDAPRWEHLITSSLPRLNHFNFEFYCSSTNDILDRLKQFQSYFWHEEHQWYTDYGYNKFYAIIHTIPFLLDDYTLKTPSIKYELNKLNKFSHVTKLTLHYEAIIDQCQYYFPNVRSLTMIHQTVFQPIVPNKEILQLIPSIVNLKNLQYLSISDLQAENMILFLLEVFKKAPNLSSLSLGCFDLQLFVNNDKLCNYLNEQIKILDLEIRSLFTSLDKVRQFCEIFSNVKQFKCLLDDPEYLLYLLNHLPHILIIETLIFSSTDLEGFVSWLNEHHPKSHTTWHMKKTFRPRTSALSSKYLNFCIWIERN